MRAAGTGPVVTASRKAGTTRASSDTLHRVAGSAQGLQIGC